MPDKTLVKLYPVPGAYVVGEPTDEREVTEAEAKRLLKYEPPIYTTTPPKKAAPAAPSKE